MKSTKYFICSFILAGLSWMLINKLPFWTLFNSWAFALFYLGIMNALCRERVEASKKDRKKSKKIMEVEP